MATTLQTRMVQIFSLLMVSLGTMVFFVSDAFAAPKPRCQVANAVGPTADRVSGEFMGLGYRLGIPLAVALFVALIFFAMTRRSGGIMKALGTVVGVVIGLGFIVGVLTALTNNPCA